MSAVRLLVLGAVRRRGRAHGYQVRTDLESWGAHEWSSATSGSVYHALKAMTGQGLLRAHESTPSAAGGPPRTEYEVTRAGITAHLPPDTNLGSWGPVGEVIGLWLHTAESRAAWTRRLIRRLEGGAYRMAGESPGGPEGAPCRTAERPSPRRD